MVGPFNEESRNDALEQIALTVLNEQFIASPATHYRVFAAVLLLIHSSGF